MRTFGNFFDLQSVDSDTTEAASQIRTEFPESQGFSQENVGNDVQASACPAAPRPLTPYSTRHSTQLRHSSSQELTDFARTAWRDQLRLRLSQHETLQQQNSSEFESTAPKSPMRILYRKLNGSVTRDITCARNESLRRRHPLRRVPTPRWTNRGVVPSSRPDKEQTGDSSIAARHVQPPLLCKEANRVASATSPPTPAPACCKKDVSFGEEIRLLVFLASLRPAFLPRDELGMHRASRVKSQLTYYWVFLLLVALCAGTFSVSVFVCSIICAPTLMLSNVLTPANITVEKAIEFKSIDRKFLNETFWHIMTHQPRLNRTEITSMGENLRKILQCASEDAASNPGILVGLSQFLPDYTPWVQRKRVPDLINKTDKNDTMFELAYGTFSFRLTTEQFSSFSAQPDFCSNGCAINAIPRNRITVPLSLTLEKLPQIGVFCSDPNKSLDNFVHFDAIIFYPYVHSSVLKPFSSRQFMSEGDGERSDVRNISKEEPFPPPIDIREFCGHRFISVLLVLKAIHVYTFSGVTHYPPFVLTPILIPCDEGKFEI